jgi:hypothetical protein
MLHKIPPTTVWLGHHEEIIRSPKFIYYIKPAFWLTEKSALLLEDYMGILAVAERSASDVKFVSFPDVGFPQNALAGHREESFDMTCSLLPPDFIH